VTRDGLKKELEHPNVWAFLKAIRLGEGTSDDAGYYRIVGGGTFTDDSQHPHIKVHIPRYDVYSTAAGAYQIIWQTWKNLQIRYGFPDFSPDCQDEAAVALIDGRSALPAIRQGELAKAVNLCAAEWASLPGSTAGQRTESYAAVQAEYLAAGGTLA
jgi:muramidase (phage lysozyme)